jgi:hypothetical protein
LRVSDRYLLKRKIIHILPIAIVAYHLNNAFYFFVRQIKERMYVSIQIGKNESGFDAIQQFVASKTIHIRNLREVEGRCIDDDDEDDDMQKATPPPQLKLFPCKLFLDVYSSA